MGAQVAPLQQGLPYEALRAPRCLRYGRSLSLLFFPEGKKSGNTLFNAGKEVLLPGDNYAHALGAGGWWQVLCTENRHCRSDGPLLPSNEHYLSCALLEEAADHGFPGTRD